MHVTCVFSALWGPDRNRYYPEEKLLLKLVYQVFTRHHKENCYFEAEG